MLSSRRWAALTLALAAILLVPNPAAAQAEKSLAKCQKSVGKEIAKYVATRQKTIAKCLDKIAAERIEAAAGDAAVAAKICASGLRKIVNTEKPAKELDEKLRAKIEKSCLAPTLEHDEGDILGDGTGVAGDQINAEPQMAIPCLHFDGDGDFATADEWVDCLVAMADAQSIRQVHLEYPNADAWLRDVRPDIVALGADRKYVDGVAALDSVRRWVDNGDGTVTDYVTGLMWEQKDDNGGIHDKDDVYTWSSGSPYDPDGTAFTVFLDTLNGGATGVGDCDSGDRLTQNGGFAGHCDWRLPTIAELRTILLGPAPCTTSSCIDEDVFGPTASVPSLYWSATSSSSSAAFAWVVIFPNGVGNFPLEKAAELLHVRAVRGGL